MSFVEFGVIGCTDFCLFSNVKTFVFYPILNTKDFFLASIRTFISQGLIIGILNIVIFRLILNKHFLSDLQNRAGLEYHHKLGVEIQAR